MELLKHFVGSSQRKCLIDALKGEEGAAFKQLFLKLNSHLICMPRTYETDGQGDKAVVSLHYFLGDSHWWIIERDVVLREQIQSFGYACLNGDIEMAESGYIDIAEILRLGAELDLYFEP